MSKRVIKLLISFAVYIVDTTQMLGCRLLRRPIPARAVVLYYHAIKPDRRYRFAYQMDALLRLSRPFCATDPDCHFTSGVNAAVTFDDGFASMIEHALPEMKKRGIPVTAFVPTGCFGARPSWISDASHSSWAERVVSVDELRTLATEPLVSIGSHSVTHPNFLELDAREAEHEFVRSKLDLETVLGHEVKTFSFPHGAHSYPIDQLARSLGYRRVFTVEPETMATTEPSFVVGRVLADPDDWPIEFRLKVVGAYRWQCFVKTLRRRRVA